MKKKSSDIPQLRNIVHIHPGIAYIDGNSPNKAGYFYDELLNPYRMYTYVSLIRLKDNIGFQWLQNSGYNCDSWLSPQFPPGEIAGINFCGEV